MVPRQAGTESITGFEGSFRQGYSRPQRIQKTTETKHGNAHEECKLHDHSTQGENHQVVFEGNESQPINA